MGMNAYAHIAYGYEIYSASDGWLVHLTDDNPLLAYEDDDTLFDKLYDLNLDGVTAQFQGDDDYGRWILCTRRHSADWAYEGRLGYEQLQVSEEDDGALIDAMEKLGIIPPSETAQWFLAASFG